MASYAENLPISHRNIVSGLEVVETLKDNSYFELNGYFDAAKGFQVPIRASEGYLHECWSKTASFGTVLDAAAGFQRPIRATEGCLHECWSKTASFSSNVSHSNVLFLVILLGRYMFGERLYPVQLCTDELFILTF